MMASMESSPVASRRAGDGSARFIVLEGVDGSGKTAVALRLQDALATMLPRRPFFTREPSDVGIISALRRVDDHRARLLMYLLDRVSHVSRIRAALSDGHWVICDRYLHSTLVYNPVPVVEGLLTFDEFYRLVLWFAGGLYPDLVLWLDCPADLAFSRIEARGTHELMADVSLLEQAISRYREVMSSLPNVVRVDASYGLDQVVASCLEALRPFLVGSRSG